VQFEGLDACVTCPEFLGKECGGGSTLTLKILHETGASIWDNTMAHDYWVEGLDEDKSFFNFLKWCKSQKFGHVMEYPIRKYKRIVESKRIALSNIPDNTPRLDYMHPFDKEFNDPNNQIIEQGGYHQMWKCTCKKTTNKGAYRDVVIETPEAYLYYYHQHCIMKRIGGRDGNTVIIDSCGFRTMTTLERINRYLNNKHVYQQKWVWYVCNKGTWKDGIKLYDGMEVKDI
jgi:hypothetical protein